MKTKTFEVCFKYEVWANYTVDASSEIEAKKLAREMLQQDKQDQLQFGEWTDSYVEEV